MSKIFGILGLVFTLAAMIAAPAKDAYAAATPMAVPMMQMKDGAPCAPKDCAAMPDCTMAMRSVSGLVAVPVPVPSIVFQPDVLAIGFPLSARMGLSSLEGDGLRRPPKI